MWIHISLDLVQMGFFIIYLFIYLFLCFFDSFINIHHNLLLLVNIKYENIVDFLDGKKHSYYIWFCFQKMVANSLY